MSTPDSPDRPTAGPATPHDGAAYDGAPYDVAAPYNAWQQAYASEPDAVESPGPRRPSSTTMRMAALVAAAALAGGGVTYVVSHDSSSGGTAQVASTGTTGQAPGGQGAPGGTGGPGGFGGVDGEQRIVGTVSAVGSSSITVATTSGTQTYQVSGATEIAKDGVQASLSDLSTGEVVLVHLVPGSNGSTDPADMTVERIIAGTGGLGGGFGPGDGNGTGGGSGNSDDATST